MPNGTPSDHDLLIRIDTTVNEIKAEYIDKDKLENRVNSSIVTHERKMQRGFMGFDWPSASSYRGCGNCNL